jgi:hypothetical protein
MLKASAERTFRKRGRDSPTVCLLVLIVGLRMRPASWYTPHQAGRRSDVTLTAQERSA